MESDFIGAVIGFVSCLLCALPFFIIGVYGKESSTPINFWSGDTSLKEKVKNVPEYNAKMARLYKKSGVTFVICGLSWFISWIVGMVFIILICTAGLYILYRGYEKILREFSDSCKEG